MRHATMRSKQPPATVFLSMAVSAILATTAVADFTSIQSGNWSDPATWGETVAPNFGADVTIASGHTVLVDIETDEVRDVQIIGTLSFDGWDSLLRARDVAVAGTVTHELNTATTTNSFGAWEPNARVNIACTNLSVVSNGKIDVNAKGYAGGKKATGNFSSGFGPGRGVRHTGFRNNWVMNASGVMQSVSLSEGMGGGHGGTTGNWNPSIGGGAAYDSATAPLLPGSGGTAGDNAGIDGTAGGGAVRIVASGNVDVQGSILASGGIPARDYGHSGGGSGGSIYITCETFSGSGAVRADGGFSATSSGGGGGGCVAIVYNPAAQAVLPLPTAYITAMGGFSAYCEVGGEAGTLYFPDNQFLTRVTAADTVRLGGRWMDETFTEWNVAALTLENAGLCFAEGFELNVAGDFTMTGATVSGRNARTYRLELSDGRLTCGGDMRVSNASVMMFADEAPGPVIVCDGDMIFENNARLFLYSALDDGMSDHTASVNVGGEMRVESSSWVCLPPASFSLDHNFAPGSALFTVGDLFVATGCGFNASLLGHGSATNNIAAGFGPGFGARYGGASHGGWGGNNALGGAPYGSTEDPVTFGSGGGGGNKTNYGARGGGVIRINAEGRVVLNGSLLANAGNADPEDNGGGSGGSINIRCDTFHGTNGVVSAAGGNSVNTSGGGGSGGRIAVNYNAVAQTAVPVPEVIFSARAGVSKKDTPVFKNGDPGTLWFPDDQLFTRAVRIPHSGTLVIPGFTRWDADELAFENGRLHLPGDFELNVAGTLTLSGTSGTILGDQLEVSNSVIRCGNLVMQQSGLVVLPGETNMDGGAYAGLVDVADAMVVGPGAWVYPLTHLQSSGIVLFRTGSLDIDATGGFNANGFGYTGGTTRRVSGNGPGGGVGYDIYGGGGGYGGKGATSTYREGSKGGVTNGVDKLPLQPGSGGGGSDRGLGGSGGGVVWVQVKGAAIVNGTVSANGGKAAGDWSGDGSGGGILIDCRSLSGSGTLAANGGVYSATGNAGANGGGGRIAVWEKVTDSARASFMAGDFKTARLIVPQPATFDGIAFAACGIVGWAGEPAEPGTVVFLTSPAEGTLFIVR